MKVVEIRRFGAANVLQESQRELSDPKEDQVIIKNYATAIDPYDIDYRAGKYGGEDKLPKVLGSSLAGVIVKTGQKVTNFKVGDRVAASPHLNSYAEFVKIKTKSLALIPDNVNFCQAAASALGYQTGYQGVIEELNFKRGQSILIHGASGAVGFAGLQAALEIGADKIYATASAKGKIFLEQFAPNIKIFDYRHEDFSAISEKLDAILDPVGGKTQDKSLELLKNNGKLRTTRDLTEKAKKSALDVQSYYLNSGQTLARLLEMISKGIFKVNIAQEADFNLENLRSFHEKFEKEHPVGKLVLRF